jgi:hypothetical protein
LKTGSRSVEFVGDDWRDVIKISSLLSSHSDLNGCLFGVTNYAGFTPLFADRGFPADLSYDVAEVIKYLSAKYDSHASWALFSELKAIDWSEAANGFDLRISELDASGHGEVLTKWLHEPGLEWVREKLMSQPDVPVRSKGRVFKRLRLTRRDSLTDTEFPLLMQLMECLAKRFGADGVRMVVWFD